MTDWIAVALVTALFVLVMAGLAREALRPFNDTDQLCSDVDEDLDVMYGGWRNGPLR